MNRYACLDAGNVVTQVVLWDGVTQWEPPDGQTLVLLPDDSGFIDARGTLDPDTLEFVRHIPTKAEEDAQRELANQQTPEVFEKSAERITALIDVLVEKGTITPADVEAVDAKVSADDI